MMEHMNEHPMMRIGIVDNDELTLAALSAYLEHRFGVGSVVWRCVLGGKAVRLCRDEKTRPDMLLLDMSLSDMDGAAVCRAIRGEDNSMPVLAVTSFPLHRFAAQVADAGGQGIVAKRNLRNIGMAVEQVAAGLTYMPPELSESMSGLRFETADKAYARLFRAAGRKPVDLSEREESIMRGYADGLTTRNRWANGLDSPKTRSRPTPGVPWRSSTPEREARRSPCGSPKSGGARRIKSYLE